MLLLELFSLQEWDEKGRPPQSVVEKVLEELSDENPEENYNQQETYCCICCFHNTDLKLVLYEINMQNKNDIYCV